MRFSLFFVLALAVLLQLVAGKVTLLNGAQGHHAGSTVDSVSVAGSPPSGAPPRGGPPPPPRTTTASSG